MPVEVEIVKVRDGPPEMVKLSAETVPPVTSPISPVTEAAPAWLTETVPPLPAVNMPKLSAAPEVWVICSGATTVAVAVPVAVAVFPPAARAGLAVRAARAMPNQRELRMDSVPLSLSSPEPGCRSPLRCTLPR